MYKITKLYKTFIDVYQISNKSTVFKLQKWHAPKNKSQLTRIFTPVITFVHQRRLQLFASLPSNGSYGEICPLRSHLSSQELLTCSLCHRSLACLIIILDTIYHHDIVKSSHHRHDVWMRLQKRLVWSWHHGRVVGMEPGRRLRVMLVVRFNQKGWDLLIRLRNSLAPGQWPAL